MRRPLMSGKAATWIVLGLAACWLVSPEELTAQLVPRILVVVTNESDAECVKRIGREHVLVERLFSPEVGALPSNYQACDERVRGLLEFHLLVFRADTYCPSECFWRQRMAVANPVGEVYQLPHPRGSAAGDCDRAIQQASDIHIALSSILPKRRRSLDANLKRELQRLHSLRLHSLQLASGE